MELDVLDLKRCAYEDALKIQLDTLAAVQSGDKNDTLILVEHPPVITMGRNAKAENLLIPEPLLTSRGIALEYVDRGGDVTYHGPGQLVGYPIFNLKKHHGGSIRLFVERLENVFIHLLQSNWQLPAGKNPCNSGVWIGDSKIVAIGLSVKRGVTMHGFAFNVTTDMTHYETIVPCGLANMGVTSLKEQTGMTLELDEIKPFVIDGFTSLFGFNR